MKKENMIPDTLADRVARGRGRYSNDKNKYTVKVNPFKRAGGEMVFIATGYINDTPVCETEPLGDFQVAEREGWERLKRRIEELR